MMPSPRIRIDQHDVGIAPRPAMLERIIEYDHSHSIGDGLANSAGALRRLDYGDPRIQALMDDRFVATISTQDDSRRYAALDEPTGEPRGDGSLSGSTDGKISDAQHRD